MKLAVVGAGKIVAEFLPHAQRIPGLTVEAIVGTERSRAALEQTAAAHGIPHAYTDVDVCLAEADVDTVWVAVPNVLHTDVARRALRAGMHVICEKPFVLRAEDLAELRGLAEERELILVEAISTQYLANVEWMRQNLGRLGDLRLVQCEYSQYSSRYDAFREGAVLPAFDPAAGGGALMDIGIYALHLVVGLMGTPETVVYTPRIERGSDTSGVTVLGYPDLTAVCIGAKDSPGPSRTKIQGTEGVMLVDGPPNEISAVELRLRDGTIERVALDHDPHRMTAEFRAFVRMIADRDLVERDRRLDHSAAVLDVAVRALDSAGIRLG
ncbi:Gfo/Idh/MocA family protein [Microbacterium oleivorans]|uniref:Gfo/Idh/MocA family protein n=1 Tax=Microbacterium oleivorans TaxID=273677 RepID=UPI002559A22A|nr:Gfo/Idh/MocA family oxidoreductase [Microbacterium oleivorans]